MCNDHRCTFNTGGHCEDIMATNVIKANVCNSHLFIIEKYFNQLCALELQCAHHNKEPIMGKIYDSFNDYKKSATRKNANKFNKEMKVVMEHFKECNKCKQNIPLQK